MLCTHWGGGGGEAGCSLGIISIIFVPHWGYLAIRESPGVGIFHKMLITLFAWLCDRPVIGGSDPWMQFSDT